MVLAAWLLKKFTSLFKSKEPGIKIENDQKEQFYNRTFQRKPIPFTIFHPADDSLNTEGRTDILFKEVFSGCSFDSYHDVLMDSRHNPSNEYLKSGLRLTTNGDVFLYDNKYYQLFDNVDYQHPYSVQIQPRLRSPRRFLDS